MTESKTIKRIDIPEIKGKSGGKAQGVAPADGFSSFLGAMDAFAPMNTELMHQATGSSNAAAVLHGAFTGVSGAAGSYGYGAQTGAGPYGGYGGFGALAEYPGMMGAGSYGTWASGKATAPGSVPGTGGAGATNPALYTADLINQMNSNNLELLKLQALMQSHTQAWNTKSNILNADHRARIAMIEKFTAR